MVKDKPKPFVFPVYCKGCGRCISACSNNCIEMGHEIDPATGLIPIELHLEQCTGCGLVRVGFRALSPAPQTALAALAVLPERSPEALICQVVGLAAEQGRHALDELEWQRWVTADARGYAFTARIVRDIVARDMLTDGQRRRIADSAGLPAT